MAVVFVGSSGGIDTYTVTSAFVTEATTLRICAPTAPAAVPHRTLLVLPVKPLLSTEFGDGLTALQALGAHNTYNCTLVAPSLATEPWFGDNPSNTGRRYESFILELRAWCDANLPAAAQTWAVSFSKGGVSVLHLMLRNPTLFDRGAAWDPPTALPFTTGPGWEMDEAYGTSANYLANYQPNAIVETVSLTPFTSTPRIWVSGDLAHTDSGIPTNYNTHVQVFAQALQAHSVPIGWMSGHQRLHRWDSGWLVDAMAWLDTPVAWSGPIALFPRPALEQLVRLRFPDTSASGNTVTNVGTSPDVTSAPLASGMTFATDGTVGPVLLQPGTNGLDFGTAFVAVDAVDKSVFARVRVSTFGAYQTILSKEDDEVLGYAVLLTPDGHLHYHVTDTLDAIDTGAPLPLATWCTLGVTWDAVTRTVTFYVNGAQQSQQAVGFGTGVEGSTASEPLLVGKSRNQSLYPFQGAWADVQLYSGILSAPQMAALHATGTLGRNYGQTFTTVTPGQSVVIAGAAHGCGHAALRVQVWDNGSPRRRLRVPYSVHPTSFDVTVTPLQPQSGLIVINGAAPASSLDGNRVFAFPTASTTWSIPGTAHGSGTPHLLLDAYDNGTPRLWLPDVDVTMDASFNLVFSFLQPQAGLVVVCAAGATGMPNSSTSFSVTPPTTVTLAGTSEAQGVQVYDAAGVVLTPQVTLHPSTFVVTVSFLQPQSGTVVRNESVYTVAGTGTLSVTQASQTLGATGTLAVQGSLTQTQAAQTLSSAALLALRATLSATQAAQTLSSTAMLPLQGTLSVTQTSQTLTATSSLALRATLSVTQAAQLLLATGAAPPLTGLLSVTQASQTLSSTGALALQGALSVTQAPQSLLALGQGAGTGLLVATQAAQTLTSTATLALRGTVALVQDAQTLAATGALTLRATLTQTQAPQTLAALGGAPGSTATLSVTQADQTLSSSSRLALQGTLSAAQAEQTLSSTARLALTASLALTQDGQSLSSSGGAGRQGTLDVLQADQTLSATARLSLTAQLTQTQADQTLTATGTSTTPPPGVLALLVWYDYYLQRQRAR